MRPESPTCATCGSILLTPAELVLPGEKCPACILAARPTPSFDFQAQESSPLSLTVDEKALVRGTQGIVHDITVAVHVAREVQCDYCSRSYPTRHMLSIKVSGPGLEDAVTTARRVAVQQANTASWLEANGVLCPHCRHFAPGAVQQHFPHGYGPFIQRAVAAAAFAQDYWLVVRALLLAFLGFLVVPGILLVVIGNVGQRFGFPDVPSWRLFACLASVCGALFLWLGLGRRWGERLERARRRRALQKGLAALEPGARHQLAMELYQAAGDSLGGWSAPDQVQPLLERAANDGLNDSELPRRSRWRGAVVRALLAAMILVPGYYLVAWGVDGYRALQHIEAVAQHRQRLAEQDRARDSALAPQALAAEQRQELDRQLAILVEIKKLSIPDSAQSPAPAMRYRALIFDERGLRTDVYNKLPPELRGRASDPNLTVILITGTDLETVGHYERLTTTFPGFPPSSHKVLTGYQAKMKVAVISWPEKRILGTYVVSGNRPPVRLEKVPEGYTISGDRVIGTTDGPLAKWIQSLKVAPRSEFGPVVHQVTMTGRATGCVSVGSRTQYCSSQRRPGLKAGGSTCRPTQRARRSRQVAPFDLGSVSQSEANQCRSPRPRPWWRTWNGRQLLQFTAPTCPSAVRGSPADTWTRK